jgi:hypothetical protein
MLPREAMSVHLWERHHRLLVGRRRGNRLRVARPWRLIDRWLHADCDRLMAHRRLLRMGGVNDDSLAALRRDATRDHASVCPRCYDRVSLDPSVFPSLRDVSPLTISRGRVSGHGFILEITNAFLGPRLRIETPAGTLYDGPEPVAPRRPWSRWLAAIPLVFALLFALLLPKSVALAATLVVVYAAFALAVGLRRSEPDGRPDRLIDHAWRFVVPQLTGEGMAFLAALCEASHGRGDPLRRDAVLRRELANPDRQARPGGNANLTAGVRQSVSARLALQRLRIVDADETGGDPAVILADTIQHCFQSRLTLAAVDLLLTDDAVAPIKARSQMARLRILVVARAFAAGLGVWDLHALGQALPRLGRLLNTEDTDGLARLRMLWDERSARPWRRCGPAATVFELVNYPMLGGQHFETAPDLLLFQPLPAGGDPVHLLACGRGLIVGGALMHEWPTPIASKPLPDSKGGGYEILFGPHSVQVHGNVEELVHKLTGWAEYFFKEFLPWIGNALTRPGDGAADRLAPLTVSCQTCRTAFVARRGEVGRRSFVETSRPPLPDSAK